MGYKAVYVVKQLNQFILILSNNFNTRLSLPSVNTLTINTLTINAMSPPKVAIIGGKYPLYSCFMYQSS